MSPTSRISAWLHRIPIQSSPPSPNISTSPPISPAILAARDHNAKVSLFASLPTELILLIRSYISQEIEYMVLRSTCSRFKTLFQDLPDMISIGMEDKMREYSRRRREFWKKELWERESKGEIKDGEMVCYACFTTH